MENTKKDIILSIVVPVYNVEQYLEKCLDSIVIQDCSELEVILVDDGSPDRSPDICDSYEKRYESISVIHKENGGLVSARKIGALATKGKYITFIDSDDWISKGYCSRIIEIIRQYSPDIIAFTEHYVVESDETITQHKASDRSGFYERKRLEKEIFPEILYKKPYYSFGITPALCLKTIRRSLLLECIQRVPNIVSMGEDLCVSLPAFLQANNAYFANFCGYYYRMNLNSITHAYDSKASVRITKLLNYLKSVADYFEEFDIETQLNMYATWIVSGTLTSLVMECSDIKKVLNEMEELLQNENVIRGERQHIPLGKKMMLKLARRKNVRFFQIIKFCVVIKNRFKHIIWCKKW